jgi:hypothetical protein
MRKLVVTIALFVAACSSSHDDHPHEGEDPGEHACENRGNAGTQVAASTDPAAAPVLTLDEPYTVALPSGEAGFVAIAGPLEGLLFAGTADVVTGLSAEGSSVDLLPQGGPSEICPAEIPEHFDLDLDASATYLVRLGPVGISEVWLMVTESEGHGHTD